jgi:predicted ATPase
MLENISINNFKSLKNVSLRLSNLNILTGLNGSGKSSLIQGILLLRQSYSISINEEQGLAISGSIINLGQGKDIFYQYAGEDETIEFTLINNSNKQSWKFKYQVDANILEAMNTPEDYLDINVFTKNFQYLNTEHVSPQTLHEKNETQIEHWNNIGFKGEYAVNYLSKYGIDKKIENNNLSHPNAKSNSLIHQTDAWLNEISPGVKLAVKEIKDIDYIKLGIQFEDKHGYTDEFQPVNVGFGITYVLPIVLSILKANAGDLLILENPESHLHPKGQSKIGSLIAYAAQSGIQVILETHSDHIINGIRVAIKKKKLEKNNVKIFFFERYMDDTDVQTIVHDISVDKNGELSNYPKGFLDEWDEQLANLI